MRSSFLLLFSFFVILSCSAHLMPPQEGSVKIFLEMQGTSGSNGASVAYNPKTKTYIAVFAGNRSYSIETFDKKGKHLHSTMALADMRGLWWNKQTKAIEGNCYSDGGIVKIEQDIEGKALGVIEERIFQGRRQPDDQSVGVFNPKKNQMVYLYGQHLHFYDRQTGRSAGSTLLSLPVEENQLVQHVVLYIGKRGKEYAVADRELNRLYFINEKTGKTSATLQLDPLASLEYNFNLAYANGYLWSFDQSTRRWQGFKLSV